MQLPEDQAAKTRKESSSRTSVSNGHTDVAAGPETPPRPVDLRAAANLSCVIRKGQAGELAPRYPSPPLRACAILRPTLRARAWQYLRTCPQARFSLAGLPAPGSARVSQLHNLTTTATPSGQV